MLKKWLRKMATKFEGRGPFSCPVEEQSEYLAKFRHPRSNIERSFFQYKAQMKLKGAWISFLINLASVPLFLIYLFMPSNRLKDRLERDAVFVKDGGVDDNVLPNSLRKEFENLESQAVEGHKLKFKDRAYILKLLLRYPLSWHLALKATIKIARYRWLVDSYSPKALIVHNEFSFTSSLLTDFCNKNGVELINVMHGEKLYFMRDSFFKFNRCYIWNEYYNELFTELRADPGQFIVEVPPSLLFESKAVEKTVDYTYYLQAQGGDGLEKIANMMKQLALNGYKVAIRPHPRYTNLELLNKYIDGSNIEVEKCKELSIEESVLRTKNVISIYSTVLQQAFYNGTNVVIDDVSDKVLYDKLKETKYIMLQFDSTILSNIIEKKEEAKV